MSLRTSSRPSGAVACHALAFHSAPGPAPRIRPGPPRVAARLACLGSDASAMENHRGLWGSRAKPHRCDRCHSYPRHRCPADPPWGTLSPRTDAPLAATIIPIALTLFNAPRDGPVAGRRSLPRPQLLASRGVHSIAKTGLRIEEPSPIPPATFVSDDTGKYILRDALSPCFSVFPGKLSTASAQILDESGLGRCTNRWKSWRRSQRMASLLLIELR